MSGLRLPLALSLAAHAMVLAALLLLPTPAPPMIPTLASRGIEVAFAPSLPKPEAPPTPQPVKAEPPPPQPPPPPIEPPPPAPEAAVAVPETPPPPPPKPPLPALRRPVVQRVERARPTFAAPPPIPVAPAAPTQQAALAPARVPAPAPSAIVSPGYEALLGAWLNSHKRYPESARERGEQGRAVLHFAVERSGRVTEFAVIKSSGYPDLDAAVEEMMRSAALPPFPADMPQPRIEVSVTIRFSLER